MPSETLAEFLRTVGEHASNTIEDNGAGWLEGAADRVDELAAERMPELQDSVRMVTDALRENSAQLSAVGGAAVYTILNHVAAGDSTAARAVYLKTRATAEWRSQARLAAGHAMGMAALERERAWDSVFRVLDRVGAAAVSFALPLLFRALPI